MTNNANETAVLLTWTGKKVWGGTGNTYYAKSPDESWKFTCDQPRKGYWVVRGWGPDGVFFYREDRTLKAVKGLADDRLNEYRAQLDRATDQVPMVSARAGFPVSAKMATLAEAFLDGMTTPSDVIQRVADKVRISEHGPQLCGCPTPTHRMSCGTGARPAVVVCGRCRMSGIDPEYSHPAEGPSWNSMGEPPVPEPCIDCMF